MRLSNRGLFVVAVVSLAPVSVAGRAVGNF